ncbi:MAG: hypothetical protein ACMUIP_15020 [bacterium]
MKEQNIHQRIVGSLSGILLFIIFFSSPEKFIAHTLSLVAAITIGGFLFAAISLILYICNRNQKGALFGTISFVCVLAALILSRTVPNQFDIYTIIMLVCLVGLSIGGFLPSFSSLVHLSGVSHFMHFKNSNITGDTYQSDNKCFFKVLDNDPRYIICLNCGHENFCSYKFCQKCNKEFVT